MLCAWLLEADGAVGQGTLQQSSSQTDPTDNFRNDGCQNSSEISRHLSGWACSQNLKQRGYDLWELWVWRSISSFACASGRVRAAQPSLAQPCTESLLERVGVGIAGFQKYLGGTEAGNCFRTAISEGQSGFLLGFNHFEALTTLLTMSRLRKHSPGSGMLVNMSL